MLWKDMCKYSIIPDDVCFGSFATLCAETGNVRVAKQLLEKWKAGLPIRNPIGHCIQLMRTFGSQHDIEAVFDTYHTLCKTAKPNQAVFVSMLSECRLAEEPEKACSLWTEICSYGIPLNEVCFGLLAGACAEAGDNKLAKELVKEMKKQHMNITDINCTQLIKTFSSANDLNTAMEVIEFMDQRNIVSSPQTYTSLIAACTNMVDIAVGEKLHQCIISKGITINLHLGNALLAM